MVLGRFAIFLDNADATYFSGQEISGKVHVWNDLPKNVRGIYVECRGIARVNFAKQEPKWRTVRRRGRSTERELSYVTVHHRSNEEYFYQRVNLKEGGNELDRGKHQYPFSFVLPDEIPSSFEGVHGHVRYTIRAVFQRRRKWNHECKIPFTVNTIMDLNSISESSSSIDASDFKTLGIFCCQSNPITAKFWLDRAGYVPGEKIYFNAEVENLTRKTMNGSKVELIERSHFHASGMTELNERVIYEFSQGHFNYAMHWENHPICVPSVVPSELRFCQIIDVAYQIKFTVNPGPLSFNLVVASPILIGNVPLRSSFANLQHDRRRIPAGASAIGESATAMLEDDDNSSWTHLRVPIANEYPDLPPPTYEECVFGGNIREEDDSEHVNYGAGVSYNPRYLTYR